MALLIEENTTQTESQPMVFWWEEKTGVPEDSVHIWRAGQEIEPGPFWWKVRTTATEPTNNLKSFPEATGNIRIKGYIEKKKKRFKKSNKRRATAQPQCAVTNEENRR